MIDPDDKARMEKDIDSLMDTMDLNKSNLIALFRLMLSNAYIMGRNAKTEAELTPEEISLEGFKREVL